jgi:prolyl-tRNA synthetase
MKRLEAVVSPAEAEPFSEDDFKRYPSLKKGYIGPGALGTNNASGIRYLVDPRIVTGTAWVTGADEYNKHVIDLTAGRDFTPDGVIEAAEVLDGDVCPNCASEVEIARGIEIGHIFQLGTKYAEALDLWVQDEDGKPLTPTMGSYGVGVSRCLAAIAEAHCDDIGLCWPRELAPADVHLVMAGKPGSPQEAAAEKLATELEAAGLKVLFDDRVKVSPGVRFKDAELIGVPTIAVVGRGIEADEPTIEVKDRRSGDREDIGLSDVVAHLVEVCRN